MHHSKWQCQCPFDVRVNQENMHGRPKYHESWVHRGGRKPGQPKYHGSWVHRSGRKRKEPYLVVWAPSRNESQDQLTHRHVRRQPELSESQKQRRLTAARSISDCSSTSWGTLLTKPWSTYNIQVQEIILPTFSWKCKPVKSSKCIDSVLAWDESPDMFRSDERLWNKVMKSSLKQASTSCRGCGHKIDPKQNDFQRKTTSKAKWS